MGKLAGLLVSGLCALALIAGCTSSDAAKNAGVCAAESDCGAGQHCSAALGCVECAFDTQCALSQRCAAGTCVDRAFCAAASDCSAPNPVCDTSTGECFPCAADADCGMGKACHAHQCAVAECSSNADCKAGSACVASQCAPSCSSDKDCAARGLLCDSASGSCQQCVSSTDCPAHFACSANTCVHTLCTAGDTRCSATPGAVDVCSAAGDRWLTLFCADSQSCIVNQGKAACANWSCTPSVTSCSTDQLRVEKCGADGETKTVDHECDPGQVCLSGACVAETCTPSQKFCRAGNVAQCSADGRTSTVAATCDSGSHCDDTALACVPNVCTPGSDTCQGNQTAHCKGDGTGFENQQDCGTSSVCVAGSCRAVACDPNEELCVGNTIQQCSADGSTQSVVQTCGEGTVCVAAAGSAPSCVADSCVAGQTQCDGNTVTQCNTAGNAFEPLTDCTATGGVCYAGQCQPKVCTSGTLSCSQGNVEVCVHNGASNALFRACNSAEFCDSSSPGCKPLVCTPNAPGCNGKFAATCNADGSGFASTGAVDCSLSGQVCDGGACKAVSCTPGAMFCQSQDVYVCNALGTAGNLSADCSNGYTHCAQSGSVAFCTYNVCSAGVATCRGNVATKCNADSSGYDTGTDCGAQACVNGACQPKICTPGALSCVSGNSQVCNATGTGTTLNQSCAASQYCSASSGSCVPDVCAAAAQGCVGEVLGLCSSDGGSVSATGSTNCKASNQLCTFAGCAATASDAISSSAQNGLNPSSQTMYGAVVYVSTARTLTGIQEYFGISSSSTMRWVVYASDTQSGPYTPIFDLLASATSIGDAEQSSPTLSVPLSAGKYYYFGAVVPGPTFFSYELTTAQRFTSFGHALGAYQATGSPPSSFTFTPNSNYPTLTLSTTLP